jgi:hypothetical protein
MVQVVYALAQGSGGAEIEDAASEWFHDHYYDWIDGKKATGDAPQDVWQNYGKDFLGRFREIGRRAANGGGIIQQATLESMSLAVERESPCPYCPDKP